MTISGSDKINSLFDVTTFSALSTAIQSRLPSVTAGNPLGLSDSMKFNSLRDEITVDVLAAYIKAKTSVPAVSSYPFAANSDNQLANSTIDVSTLGHMVNYTMTELGVDGTQLAVLTLNSVSKPINVNTTVTIVGRTATSTITLQSGTLPTGMTLSSGAGTIAGTPTVAAVYNFTLREALATAANSPKDTALTITITP